MFIATANAASDTNSSDTISIQQTEVVAKEPEAASNSSWMSMVPMVLIFVVFYFLLIRPQEKRRKEKEALVSGVKKGEKVLTTGGIFGEVIKINDSDNTVEVEIAQGVQIKILKTAIADITSRPKEITPIAVKSKKDKGAK